MTTIANPMNKNVQYGAISEGRGVDESGQAPVSSYRPEQYKLYPWRWFMLGTLCFLNVSNGMVSEWVGWGHLQLQCGCLLCLQI